jgi:hypothetical protein
MPGDTPLQGHRFTPNPAQGNTAKRMDAALSALRASSAWARSTSPVPRFTAEQVDQRWRRILAEISS